MGLLLKPAEFTAQCDSNAVRFKKIFWTKGHGVIANIQILRAFAALNVVLFHVIGSSKSYGYNTNYLSVLEGWGSSGVDIFFVISGFVMLFTQLENKRSVSEFLKSRLIRIAPIYWIVSAFVILVYFFVPSAFKAMIITPDWALSSFFFLSGPLLGEHPLVHVGWTLEWEMLFYLVFGVSLWFRSWLVSLSIVFLVLIAFGIVSSNLILLEFLGGVLIAIVYKKFGNNDRLGMFCLVLGSVLLCMSILPSWRNWIDERVILWGIPSFFVVYGALTIKQFQNKTAQLLGDASYSIYLLQVLTIPAFYKLASKLDFPLHNDLLALACLTATAICGVVMFLLLERPMTNFLKHTLRSNTKRPDKHLARRIE